MKIKHTVCPSCSLGCGINLITQNGEVVGTYPYKRHEFNEGKNCLKGRNCYKLTDENRIENPLIKKGTLKKADWDEALDMIVSEIESYDADEIGILVSGTCSNEVCELSKKFADAKGILNIGFGVEISQNLKNVDFSVDDLENSDIIVIFGDILKENPLMGRRVILAQDNGVKIISLDSNDSTSTSLIADEYIQIDSIKNFLDNDSTLAEQLSGSSTVLIKSTNSSEDLNAVKELTSNVGSKLITILNECNSLGAMESLTPLDQNEVQDLIEKVKLLYVIGGNPASYAEDSLKSINSLITEGYELNQTALMSDVVLPSTCWAETEGSFTNTMGNQQNFSKIVEPQENIRDDKTIIREIAEKMGITL
jgi:formate dehydrogenase major subunit